MYFVPSKSMSLTATVVEVRRSQALKTEPYPPFEKKRVE